MKLFNTAQLAQINEVAAKSNSSMTQSTKGKSSVKGLNEELKRISDMVLEYFKDSPAILITDVVTLHEYVSKLIEAGYAGIDTETTGLDRVKDTIVGFSLYYPGGVEAYIPNRHLIPIFDEPYKNQLTYEQCAFELRRIVEAQVRLIFANADFDLAMIMKDYKVDLLPAFYFDIILGWRCLKEDEKDNTLKGLYNKYVLKGKGDPKKFSDFFTPQLFPYCKPEVAKLYAANDARITYDMFIFELPFLTKTHKKCQKNHLEKIADLFWNIEMPLVTVCQTMHRVGIHIDKAVAAPLLARYTAQLDHETKVLADMVQELIDRGDYSSRSKRPFATGKDFNPKSSTHAKYLIYTMLQIPNSRNEGGTGKDVLAELNLPVTNQILKVRSINVLMSTFVKKMPMATSADSRIHAQFKQIGAATGRLSSAEPNVQNIPSHAVDIRHMFRATPANNRVVPATEDNGRISFNVSRWASIMINAQSDKKVINDLQINDTVMLKESNQMVECTIVDLQESTKDLSTLDITVIPHKGASA